MFVDSAKRVAFRGRAPEEPVVAFLEALLVLDSPVLVAKRDEVGSL